MKKSALIMAALISASVSFPALANTTAMPVRTADLDLSGAIGRETLARRISAAAEQLCIVEGDRSLTAFSTGQACYRQAVRDAHAKLAKVSDELALAAY